MKWGRDPRIFEIKSTEFLDDGNGHVSGVRTVKIEWKKDASGRFMMQDVEGACKDLLHCSAVLCFVASCHYCT